MNPLEYLLYSLPYWYEYVEFLIFFILLHWFLLIRPCTRGIFDPLFILLIGSAFGWAIVWFMYFRGDIEYKYFLSFSISEIAFSIGLYIARGRNKNKRLTYLASNEKQNLAIGAFVASSAIHIITTISIWAMVGIPLFRSSRLGAFENSGGFGILERLNGSCGSIALFSSLYFLMTNAKTKYQNIYYVFILWYFVAMAFSGSKAAFLSIGLCFFAVAFIYSNLPERNDSFWGGRTGKIFIIAATLFSLFVISIQNDSGITESLFQFLFRLVSFGDVYIEAYINNNIEELRGENQFIGLFGGFLSTFRLFPVENIHPNIGWQLTLLIFPDMDIIVGPNPRHPVFGYHYFGVGAFIFSFILGLITSRLNSMLYLKQHKTFIGSLLAFMGYFSLVSLSTDFGFALDQLASSIIGLGFVFIPVLLLLPRATIFKMRHHRTINRISQL